jgi:hypothetical protein
MATSADGRRKFDVYTRGVRRLSRARDHGVWSSIAASPVGTKCYFRLSEMVLRMRSCRSLAKFSLLIPT